MNGHLASQSAGSGRDGGGPSPADAAFRKVSFRLLPLLMICYVLAYLDRQNVGFAKLQFMEDLGFSNAVFGLGAGLFYLGYCLFEVPSNFLLQRAGARATLFRIMLGWGLVAMLFAFMLTSTHFYILRFLLGVAEAGFFPGVLLYISFWVPPSRRAAFTAMFMAAMPISGILGAPISGFIMVSADGLKGLAGWQWMFLIEGLPSVIMALVVFRLLPDRPADASWLTPADKSALLAELEAEQRIKEEKTVERNFLAVATNWRIYGLAGMSVSLLSCIAGLQLWLPTMIRGAGVKNLLDVGLLAAVPPLVAIVAQQYVARRSDRLQERRWHSALPVFAAAIAFALLPVAEGQLVLSLLLLIVIAAGLFSATGPYWSLPSTILTGSAATGGIALVTALGGLGAFGSNWLTGVVTDWADTPNVGVLVYAVLALIGPILMLIATRERRAVK